MHTHTYVCVYVCVCACAAITTNLIKKGKAKSFVKG